MLAVVTISGKQYIVSKGDVIEVDRVNGKKGETLTFDSVLLIVDDKEKVKVGKPFVKGALVKATLVEEKKGAKIQVRRFKSKVRYRKTTGFRPLLTKLEITAIEA